MYDSERVIYPRDLVEIWEMVAVKREAKGDTEGARLARQAAAINRP